MIRSTLLLLGGSLSRTFLRGASPRLSNGPTDHSTKARNITPVLRLKLVACVHLGRIEEAHELLRQVLDRQPDLTIDGLKAYPGMTVTPEIFDIWVEGFRTAGLPE